MIIFLTREFVLKWCLLKPAPCAPLNFRGRACFKINSQIHSEKGPFWIEFGGGKKALFLGIKRYELQCGNYKQYPALCAFFENQRADLERTDFFTSPYPI